MCFVTLIIMIFNSIRDLAHNCIVSSQLSDKDMLQEKQPLCVSSVIAEQINSDFRENCSDYDAEDRESWSIAATIYAGE